VQAEPALPKQKLKMKIRNFVITLGVAICATLNVMATDALLSPRAADNQPKAVSGFNADPNLAAPGPISAPPRVLDHQTKTVSSKSTAVTPSSQCVRRMNGTPKMIGQCAEHASAAMSCCSVADGK
jgi:hypothetical protein